MRSRNRRSPRPAYLPWVLLCVLAPLGLALVAGLAYVAALGL